MKNAVQYEYVRPSFFQGERLLVYTGMLGLVLGAFCAGYILITGGIQAPEGDLSKALSFNVAFGIFVLTTALILPFAGFKESTRSKIRWTIIISSLYGYGVETMQHMRGIDPRFTQHGGGVDVLLSMLFGVASLAIIVSYVFITIQFFRKKQSENRPHLIIGIRYGLITTMLSFAAGLWIIFLASRYTGIDGNIIWFHGFGFHGLQLLPLIGWMMEMQRLTSYKFLHLSGWLWIIFITLLGVQTLIGESVFQFDFMMIAAWSCLIVTFILFMWLVKGAYPHLKGAWPTLSVFKQRS